MAITISLTEAAHRAAVSLPTAAKYRPLLKAFKAPRVGKSKRDLYYTSVVRQLIKLRDEGLGRRGKVKSKSRKAKARG